MRSSPSISALTAGSSFKPAIQAFTKNDMKPSRAPCFFSKFSFSRSRSAMTLVMSTSLKVVSMAAVFCASLRRLAMVRPCRRGLRRRASVAGFDATEPAADLHRGPSLDRELGCGPRRGRRHLDGNLVGLELAQRLIDGDAVAHLDHPLGDGRLGDRFSQC